MITDFPNDSKDFDQYIKGKTLYWKNYCHYHVLVNIHNIMSHGENIEANIFLTCAATSFTTTRHAEECEDNSVSAIAVA